VDRSQRRYPVLALRIRHVFPTLGKVFFLQGRLLTEQESASLPQLVRTALDPLVKLDPRHTAWPK